MSAARTSIGFVGLGNMGGNMAERLLAAGYPVSGWQRSHEHAQHLIEQGLQWRDTPRAVAEGAEVVVTSLPDDAVLDEVATGAGRDPGRARRGQDLDRHEHRQPGEEHGARGPGTRPGCMDARRARVGERPAGAGRDADDHGRRGRRRLRRVEPLLRELGTPNYIGDNGQGLALKLAINISLAVQMLAFAEGLLLAERSGIDRQRALDVMEESPIGSPMLRARASIILDPPEEAWFDLRFMHKDIELALDAARRLGIPLPTAARADEVLEQAVALGYERRDLAALFQALEDIATRRPVDRMATRAMGESAQRDITETLWPPAAAKEDGLPPLLIVLTIVTGVVDALAYLRLGHVFVANMTGNVVFLGFAAAGAGGLSVPGSLLALAFFLCGGIAAGRLAGRLGD